MCNPLLSIIMPVYNAEDRLDISIKSIINQKYRNIELILVNDGSTDSSPKICKYFAENDKRIVIINQNNSGVSSARNTGIKKAKGEYITFVDADDTIRENIYTKSIEKLCSSKADIVMFGMSFDYYIGDKFSKTKKLYVKNSFSFFSNEIKEYFFELYNLNYLSSVWNKVIKSNLINGNNIYFNSKMAILEDFKFVLDILEQSSKIVVLDDVFYHYYNQEKENSLIRRPNIDYFNNFRILDKKLRSFAKILEMNKKSDIQKINAMILRYYIIGLEKLFSSDADLLTKYNKLKEYISNERIRKAISNSKCEGKRLKLVRLLMEKKMDKTLFVLFDLNSFYKYIRDKIV